MKSLVRMIYSTVIGFGITIVLVACANPAAAEIQGKIPDSVTMYSQELQKSSEEQQDRATEQPKENKKDEKSSQDFLDRTQEADMDGKILVVYFSCTGTTETLAQYAADILEADIYEIIPEEPYTETDLAYYTGGRADQEQNDSSSRPSISGNVENMTDYHTIILAYPIWHGQAPRIIGTFLESYNLSGKTILPFCTSHSSGIGSSADNLHTLCPDSVKWLEGKRFDAQTSKTEMEKWLENQLGGSLHER